MNWFDRFSKLTLIFTLIVTFAGGFVRMTGSGMGCPDWPKCFGLIIPPTHQDQIEWKSGADYTKGQIILWQEKLMVAKESFKTGTTFENSKWEPYTKHDYSKFNPAHTWIEYLNRLSGAMLGVFSLLMLVGAMKDKDRLKILLSLIVVILISFEGWLGMKVVESVLKPVIISMHMLVALIILILMVKVRVSFFESAVFRMRNRPRLIGFIVVCLILSILQILLGTQVREGMEMASKVVADRSEWFRILSNQPWLNNNTTYLSLFYIHRTSSLLIIGLNYGLYHMLKPYFRYPQIHKYANLLMYVLLAEIATGAVMYYIDIPGLMQLLHLMLSAFMLAIQAYLYMVVRNARAMKVV